MRLDNEFTVPARIGLAYEDTAVGRLPLGPAGDAALAAAVPPPRRAAEVLDLGAASRAAILRRAAPPAAAAVAAGFVFWLWRRR